MTVDLLYVAKNRMEFTRESFSMLLEHTDWSLVNEFIVYDDGSEDGTQAYLSDRVRLMQSLDAQKSLSRKIDLRQTQIGSPVTILNDFINRTKSSLIAKIDNDTILPPRWLNSCVDVLAASPKLECLGIEAWHTVDPNPYALRAYEPCRYTGGIGVFRRTAFRRTMPRAQNCYFGFGDWQQKWKIKCGWIAPSMPVFLLDRLPFEPWASLSRLYIEKGWQRTGAIYEGSRQDLWSWRFPNA